MTKRLVGRAIVAAAAALALGASAAAAQQSYPSVRVSGRAQQQFYYFDNEAYADDVGPQSQFLIRRARVEARVDITDRISALVQPSFEGGREEGVRLRDAWVDVRLTAPASPTAIVLRGGQEKRPFSRYDLLSSTNLPTIERGAGDGLPGSASNDLFDDAGFLSHDVGASLRLEHALGGDRAVTLMAGVYNGQGESLEDENGAKSFGVRATVGLWRKLDLGGSYFSHDQILDLPGGAPADSAFRNDGWAVDLAWSEPGQPGLFLLAEYLQGEQAAPGTPTMRGAQAVAAFNVRTGSRGLVQAIEPAARIDVADPNTDAGDDRVTTISAGLGVYFASRAHLRAMFEHQSFQAAGAESVSGVRSQLSINF